jgi:hypothetical protein
VTDLGSVLKVEFTGFVEARLGNRLVKVLQRNQSIMRNWPTELWRSRSSTTCPEVRDLVY